MACGFDADGSLEECTTYPAEEEPTYRLFVIGLNQNVSIVVKRDGIQVATLDVQPNYADGTDGCRIAHATLQL